MSYFIKVAPNLMMLKISGASGMVPLWKAHIAILHYSLQKSPQKIAVLQSRR